MSEELTPATFRPHVEQTFTVDLGAGATAEVRLVSLRESPFTLIFSGPAETAFPQGLYWFSRPDHGFGPVGMFVEPIGRGADGRQRYEAVF